MSGIPQKSHSAEVRMQLHLGGRTLAIAQLGPEFLILKEPIEHPPTDAEITLWIDGRVRRWHVRLQAGIQVGKVKTPVSNFQSGSAVA
jgi:hypothetical protein